MSKFRFAWNIAFVVLTFMAFAQITQAQATRTWVSGVGDDVNPCSRTAPCKTFAGAISKTATGGEINCLDAGGFGAVTITKSITIDGTSVPASILASGTTGIIINITSVSDTAKTVRIRGLSINGASTGISGIRVLAANKVFVEDTIIDGFTSHGINIITSAPVQASVKNLVIRNNTGNGINVSPTVSSSTTTLSVDKSYLQANAIGLYSNNNTRIVIRDSVVTNNSSGLVADTSNLSVFSCLIGYNFTGIQSNVSSTVSLSNNTVTNNNTGLFPNGGTIISFGNNSINNNITNGSVTSTVTQQ